VTFRKLNLNSGVKTESGLQSGFTLIELLVVVSIIAILAGMLLPALGRAQQKTQLVNCLSNLGQIGIGMKLYVDENRETFPPGDSQQFNWNAPLVLHGNALGGTDPREDFRKFYPMASNRLLTHYVPARQAWHCPADRGLEFPQEKIKPSSYEVAGSSYRFNWDLQQSYVNQSPPVAEDPAYNLAAKKESWSPEPSRFIMMHEVATYPWDTVSGESGIAQWHYSADPGKIFSPARLKTARNKFIAPILLVDGHIQQSDFTKTFQANPLRALEPGKDWMWYKPVK
jgi:prepilin-type N-terminal cleavage/methylation domain-containing protein